MTAFRMLSIAELENRGEASLQTGPFGTQLKASDYVDDGVPVINVRNIGLGNIRKENLEFVNEAKSEKLYQHVLQEGDIVFGRKGAVERHALINSATSGWIQGSDCLRLRINSGEVCYRYLSYYLRTQGHQDWMQALCSFGATMSSLNQDIVRRLSFLKPPLKTQKKIAAILTAYDDLIENNQRRIALLEKMAEEIYREWFVRMRFPGHDRVKFEKGVPEGWSVKNFSDIVEYYIGGGWGEEIQTGDFYEPGYVVRGTDIPGFNVGIFSAPYRFHRHSNLKSRALIAGDFVFEVSGGSKGQLLGRNVLITQAMIDSFGGSIMCASFCKLIRFNERFVLPSLMKYFLKLFYESDLVGLYQIQSTGISNYQFEAFLKFQTMLVPPLQLQELFDNKVAPIADLKDNLSVQNAELKKTRDALLPRLISGKLSVENLDIQFPPSMQDAANET